jgi:spore maturation protein CgeB
MTDLLRANLTALRRHSPELAAALELQAGDGRYAIETAVSGQPIVTYGGRALDSRRDPVRSADQAASECPTGRVVLLGIGAGHLADALEARGIEIGAVVVPDAGGVRAWLCARDAGRLLDRVPVFLLEALTDRTVLARVRGLGVKAVVHAASAAQTPALAALGDRWERLRPARRPRIMVVGPIYGGSLGVATHVAASLRRAGAETSFFDAQEYAGAHRALAMLPTHRRVHDYLRGKLALLLGEAALEVARAFCPDLVLALAQAPLAEPSLTALRSGGITTAFWFVENGRVLPYWRDVARHYDLFYAIQAGRFLEELHAAGAGRAAYLPLACDPAVHVPVTLDEAAMVEYGADVSFAGAPYLNRRRVFASLADLDLKLWGDGWNATSLSARAAGGAFDLDRMLRIFAATRVNLNLHSADHTGGLDPSPDYVNPRTFELASCGAFQVVDTRGPLRDLFTADEIVTFDSVGDLRSTIAYYLEHPAERKAVAARARARAHRDHTYAQRIDRIFTDALPPELVAGARWDASPATLDDAIAPLGSEGELSRDEALLRIVRDVRQTVRAL